MTSDQDRVESERVERLYEMTVGELIHMGEDDGNQQDMEEVLSLILQWAVDFYDWDRDDDFRSWAVSLAQLAVNTNGIDEYTAKKMAKFMAALAHYMLQAQGAGEWDFKTLTALKEIRDTGPKFFPVTETTGVAS